MALNTATSSCILLTGALGTSLTAGAILSLGRSSQSIVSTALGLGITFKTPVSLGSSTCALSSTGVGLETFTNYRSSLGTTVTSLGYTVHQALQSIFSVWGGGCDDCVADADGAKVKAALDILNGCVQEIYLHSKELQYLGRETITATLGGTDQLMHYFELPSTVQAVVGPVKLTTRNADQTFTARQMNGVQTKSHCMNYTEYFKTNGKNSTVAYWVDRSAQTGGDRTRIRIYTPVNPFTGETNYSVTLDVEKELPRYTAADCVGTVLIPLPHQYAESLLVPLMKEKAAANPNAVRRDNYPMYQAEAASARVMFGLADPQNPTIDKSGGKP